MTVEEQLSVEEELEDFAADFVSDKHSDSRLRHLFEQASGEWFAAKQFCDEETAMTRLSTLEESADGTLRVAWLAHPEAYDEGFVTVLFFVDSLFWHTLAIYNKGRLDSLNSLE